ncbi:MULTISPECIES: serine protease [unclassified Pseudomonas]|uniref:serine protease n=1 Tax=unclassified Pseudomonas TaxID=196821 RepID=UPI0030D95E2D
MNIIRIALSGLLLGSLAGQLAAAPRDFGEGLANASPAHRLSNANHQHDHWNGIGRIRNQAQTLCTASLLDTRDDAGRSGPAYVVTSSHCLHRLNGSVQKDLPIKGSVSFNYFDDTLETLKTYSLKTLKWGSSQGVDLAIIELQASLADLIKAGITPLKLAEEIPADGNDILALAAPEWDTLHVSACSHQASRELVEQPFVWRVTMKNQCQGVGLGGFGGPLLDRATNTLFGVLSTSTTGQPEERKCQRDAPCEVNSGIPVWHAETNYGSPVTFLNQCFVRGVLQADSEDCNLYPTTTITFASPEPIQQYFTRKGNGKGKDIVPRWNLKFTTNTPFYRYKITRRAIDCESPVHYSAPIKAANAFVNDAIGPQTGMHMLCIVGVDSAEQRVTDGMMRNALTLAVELAEPGPARTPNLTITLDKQGSAAYTVIWNLASPFMHRYTYKFGPAATTDCLRPVGYLPIPPAPTPPEDDDDDIIDIVHPLNDYPDMPLEKYLRLITVRETPYKICTYAYDQADQPSTLRVDLLKPR